MTRTRRSAAALALAALAVLGATAGASCGGGGGTTTVTATPGETTAPPPTTAPPTTAPPATETAPPTKTITVSVYLLRGEKVGVVHRQVPATTAVAAAAMRELLKGPTPQERELGFGTAIPAGTALNGVAIESGLATVDLSRQYASGGGSLSMFTRLAEVVFTLTQFPTVKGVNFELDGTPVTVFSSEGIGLDHPQTRKDYEDQAPAILVESPAPNDVVSSPLRITGSANVFEATFQAVVVDWDGKIVAQKTVMATCGTGCRGTFDTKIRFEWSGPARGALIVYEVSAKDGSHINTVEIPLRFE
jgi:germination protein M